MDARMETRLHLPRSHRSVLPSTVLQRAAPSGARRRCRESYLPQQPTACTTLMATGIGCRLLFPRMGTTIQVHRRSLRQTHRPHGELHRGQRTRTLFGYQRQRRLYAGTGCETHGRTGARSRLVDQLLHHAQPHALHRRHTPTGLDTYPTRATIQPDTVFPRLYTTTATIQSTPQVHLQRRHAIWLPTQRETALYGTYARLSTRGHRRQPCVLGIHRQMDEKSQTCG